MARVELRSKAECATFCEDLAQVALDWTADYLLHDSVSYACEWDATDVCLLGREMADRLERWLMA